MKKIVIYTSSLLHVLIALAYNDSVAEPEIFLAPGRINRMLSHPSNKDSGSQSLSSVLGNFFAPGLISRIMPRAPGRDCGSYTLDCKGAEGACNNACYHSNCIANASTHPDRFTYVGRGANTERDRNREQPGCTAGSGGSVCGRYPFSQKFRDSTLRGTVQCDEWPMASSIQANLIPWVIRNSLRCIPGSENAGKQRAKNLVISAPIMLLDADSIYSVY